MENLRPVSYSYIEHTNQESRNMKKILTYVTAASLALGIGAYSSANASLNGKPMRGAANGQITSTPEYLFVISSKRSKIKQDDSGAYTLGLQLSNINQVIMFSESPNRIVKYISGNDLKNIWREGDDSFQNDPPNAVLNAKGMKPAVITLMGVNVADKLITFKFKPTAKSDSNVKPNNNLKNVNITIDAGFGSM